MKKNIIAVLGCVALLFARGHEEPDSCKINNANVISKTDTVYIAYPVNGGNTEELNNTISTYFAKYQAKFKEILMEENTFSNITILNAGDPIPSTGLILKSTLIEIDGGNKALRMFVGFGAGSTWAEFSCEAFNAGDTTAALFMKHRKGSAGGMKSDEAIENVEEVATAFAYKIVSLKK